MPSALVSLLQLFIPLQTLPGLSFTQPPLLTCLLGFYLIYTWSVHSQVYRDLRNPEQCPRNVLKAREPAGDLMQLLRAMSLKCAKQQNVSCHLKSLRELYAHMLLFSLSYDYETEAKKSSANCLKKQQLSSTFSQKSVENHISLQVATFHLNFPLNN